MKWRIETFSNRRLEAEISRYYWSAYETVPGVTPKEVGILGDLWAEFDRRVAGGTMTDDDEAVLDASGRWIG